MKQILFILVFAASFSVAAGECDFIKKLDPAWKSMEARVTQLVGQAGQRTLLDMAFAQVAVDACPGLTINAKGYRDAFAGLIKGKTQNAAEHRRFEHALMTDFGVYTGLILAESFLDKAEFCRSVDNVKTRKAGPSRFWTTR